MLNAKITKDLSLEDFCDLIKGKIDARFKRGGALSQVGLKNTVALYEMIELRYFQFVQESLRPEFKKMDKREVIKENFENIL